MSVLPALRMRNFPTNAFAYFSGLAVQHSAVNLGQGFPTFGTPKFVQEAGVRAVCGPHNQYMRPAGSPEFVNFLANMYSPMYDRELQGMEEIVTYNGAQQGIQCIMTAFCDEDDEVLMIEPFFDAYKKSASLVGAKVKGVPLHYQSSISSAKDTLSNANDWEINYDELARAIGPKTRLLILNTPQTFIGKVYSSSELEKIAEVVRCANDRLVVVSDEVYEFSCFSGYKHTRFATLPGMYDRTISLFSAGKTFSCTGWRCGYSIAPHHLSAHLAEAVAAISFCAPTPLIEGVRNAFEHANSGKGDDDYDVGYYDWLSATLQKKRDILVEGLKNTVLEPVIPNGGYFLMAKTKNFTLPGEVDLNEKNQNKSFSLTDRRDWKICEWLTQEIGVAAIPACIAYLPPSSHVSDNFIRFAFCKEDDELKEAATRLAVLSK